MASLEQRPATGHGLRVIPPGVEAELTSEATQVFLTEQAIRQFRHSARFVVIDAPPMSSGSQAQTLARLAHVTVLVVELGTTTHDQVLRAARLIDLVGTRSIGMVAMPRVPVRREKRAAPAAVPPARDRDGDRSRDRHRGSGEPRPRPDRYGSTSADRYGSTSADRYGSDRYDGYGTDERRYQADRPPPRPRTGTGRRRRPRGRGRSRRRSTAGANGNARRGRTAAANAHQRHRGRRRPGCRGGDRRADPPDHPAGGGLSRCPERSLRLLALPLVPPCSPPAAAAARR